MFRSLALFILPTTGAAHGPFDNILFLPITRETIDLLPVLASPDTSNLRTFPSSASMFGREPIRSICWRAGCICGRFTASRFPVISRWSFSATNGKNLSSLSISWSRWLWKTPYAAGFPRNSPYRSSQEWIWHSWQTRYIWLYKRLFASSLLANTGKAFCYAVLPVFAKVILIRSQGQHLYY